MAVMSIPDLVLVLRSCRLLDAAQLETVPQLAERFQDARLLARELMNRGWLTAYQANQLLQGRGQSLQMGPYLLLERVGEGGMGTVFKARHDRMGRIVAIKVMRKE